MTPVWASKYRENRNPGNFFSSRNGHLPATFPDIALLGKRISKSDFWYAKFILAKEFSPTGRPSSGTPLTHALTIFQHYLLTQFPRSHQHIQCRVNMEMMLPETLADAEPGILRSRSWGISMAGIEPPKAGSLGSPRSSGIGRGWRRAGFSADAAATSIFPGWSWSRQRAAKKIHDLPIKDLHHHGRILGHCYDIDNPTTGRELWPETCAAPLGG
ncbi:hypothetical protein QBC47DRAFT_44076 [Echria macrotheca]|uniref:Uncharacterized protein n=1 Tax=Echria macrotheca TaxID=438768 RepID=A0AAJ0B8J9_9PEZI|nr:hypothetical protein QBC47DRAFT_44076 [Echria macrotheca]